MQKPRKIQLNPIYYYDEAFFVRFCQEEFYKVYLLFTECLATVMTLTQTPLQEGARRRETDGADHDHEKRNQDTGPGQGLGAEIGGGDPDRDHETGSTEIGTEGSRGLEIGGRGLPLPQDLERM